MVPLLASSLLVLTGSQARGDYVLGYMHCWRVDFEMAHCNTQYDRAESSLVQYRFKELWARVLSFWSYNTSLLLPKRA